MSLFKPKDGDYIVRGLALLGAWWIVVTPVLMFVIAVATRNGNAGALGLPLGVVSGICFYGWYLDFGLRQHHRNGYAQVRGLANESRAYMDWKLKRLEAETMKEED